MVMTKEASLQIIQKWMEAEHNRSGEGSPYIDDSLGLQSVLIDGRVNVEKLAEMLAGEV